MSRCYESRGHWIKSGLTQYIVIYRKHENCCEIQIDAIFFSGILIHLKLIKNSSEEDIQYPEKDDVVLHGTKMMFNFLQP